MANRFESVANAAVLLGSVFYQDPSSEKGQAVLGWFASPEAADAWEFGQPQAGQGIALMQSALTENQAQANHEEFNRLFVGPYRLPAPAWASVYTDPEGVIFGNATLGVRQWMRDNQVKMTLPNNEPEDHFGLMLMMLSWAVTHEVSEDAICAFLQEHLLTWCFYYLQLFAASTENPLYKGAAQVAQATLADWVERFQLEVPQISLHPRQ